jgi:cytochrome c
MFLRTTIFAALAAGFVLASPAQAVEDALPLAKKYNCLACHQVDRKSVGPAYKDVAKKYKGQNVTAKLMEKVKKGGAGVWGQVPMAPNPTVPEADLKKLVTWILSL